MACHLDGAIFWTKPGILFIGPSGTNFNEIFLSEFKDFHPRKMHLKMSSEMAPILSLPQCVNILRPRQDGHHFADDGFKCIFVNENVGISIKISPKFIPKGAINNIPALVQIMAWRPGQATSHYLNQWCLDYWQIYGSLGPNELMKVPAGRQTRSDCSWLRSVWVARVT